MIKKVLVTIIAIIIGAGIVFFVNQKYFVKKTTEKKQKKEVLIDDYYNEYVKTKKETKIYKKEDNKYIEIGKINKDVQLELEKRSKKNKEKYFKILDSDIYIYYDTVSPIKTFIRNDRYKNYIPFNKNVKTKSSAKLYDNEGNYLYELGDSTDFKILVMDDNKYGIEYNNSLLYLNKEDSENIYDSNNNSSNKKRIRTLTYHLIYNPSKRECKEDICQSLDLLEQHLKYIRENEYFTLKLDELELYLSGKINIPEKSIVLTTDDGTVFDLDAIKLLEKYKANMTLFVITSVVNNIDKLKSDYLDLESHTHNMHNQYECPGYGMQGGGILCLPEEKVLEDLKTSSEKLGGSKYLSYPFFDFNDRAIELLKKAGFKLAFIGQYDTEGYSYPLVTDHYKVRRMTIFSDISMDEFISYLN